MGQDVGVALTKHGADRGALNELHAGSFVTTTGMRPPPPFGPQHVARHVLEALHFLP